MMDDYVPLTQPLVSLAKAVSLLTLLVAIGKALREYVLVPRLTAVKDLPQLGKPRKGGRLPGTVVVCGRRYAQCTVTTDISLLRLHDSEQRCRLGDCCSLCQSLRISHRRGGGDLGNQ